MDRAVADNAGSPPPQPRAESGRFAPNPPDRPPKRHRYRKKRLGSLSDLDLRTGPGQRALALARALETDLGRDLSSGQRELVKRAALLSVLTEDCESRWLKHEPVAVADYVSLVNAERRVLVTLGLERRAIDVSRRERELEDREAGLIE